MDAELRQFLEEKFGQVADQVAAVDKRFDQVADQFAAIDKRFDQVADQFAAERKYVDDLFVAMKKHVEEYRGISREEFDEQFMDTFARIDKSETNLLRAFHGWARPMELRMRNSEMVVGGFEERLIMLEERLAELERKQK